MKVKLLKKVRKRFVVVKLNPWEVKEHYISVLKCFKYELLLLDKGKKVICHFNIIYMRDYILYILRKEYFKYTRKYKESQKSRQTIKW